jgi:hypothetical protein
VEIVQMEEDYSVQPPLELGTDATDEDRIFGWMMCLEAVLPVILSRRNAVALARGQSFVVQFSPRANQELSLVVRVRHH